MTVKRSEGHQLPAAQLLTALPREDRTRLQSVTFPYSVVMRLFFKSHDPNVQLPSNKLDCTCVVERIFLTVKSDHVFLAHCDNKPEFS